MIIPDGSDVFEKPTTDKWTHAKLNLPQGDILWKAKVISLTKDGNGDIKGSHGPNPFFKTLTCDLELPFGEIKEHLDNDID